MADTPFLSWQFAGSGSSVLRTQPTRIGEILNVKEFGAVGDGAVDDTAAIQATLDAAFGPSSNPHDTNTALNKPVWFPAGTYKITGPLRVTTVRSGRIYGDGMLASTIQWSGGAFNGNTLGIAAGSTDNGSPNNEVSCMLEIAGMARSHISDLQFSWGNAQDKNTACIYGYGHKTSTQVVWQNVCMAGGTYGIILGAGSPNGVSEWKFYNCFIALCGQAGVYITGQNTLNHNFVNCSIGDCGYQPIETTFTGSITSNTLTITAFTSGASNPKIEAGFLIYNSTGGVKGNTFISSLGTSTGATGTANVTVTHSSSGTGAMTIHALSLNMGGLVNVNGSMPYVAGFDTTANSWDILDTSANALSVSGVRAESKNFLQCGAGTAVTINDCSIRAAYAIGSSCTTLGPILHVEGLASSSPSHFDPGQYITGTDGVNSLPETGLSPPVTYIVKQISGSVGSSGDYLMSTQPSGDLTSFTCTGRPQFLMMTGQGNCSLNECNAPFAVIAGSNNSQLRIRNNNFTATGSPVNPDLLRGYAGQVLEYDVACTASFTANNLPTPHNRFKGVRMFVVDSSLAFTAANVGAAISTGGGGGVNAVPLTCSGSAWLIG